MKLFLNFVKGIYYGIKIEEGYSYKKVYCEYMRVFEYRHEDLISEGWEKFTDVESNIFNAWCWYRRKK